MDLHDQIPVLVLHVLEADVSKDTGVVDKDINPPKFPDCGLNDPFSILNAIVVCNGLASSGFDLVDDNIGGLLTLEMAFVLGLIPEPDLCRLSFSFERTSEVINHHIGAFGAKKGSICLAQPTTGAGDHHRLAVEAQFRHCATELGQTASV